MVPYFVMYDIQTYLKRCRSKCRKIKFSTLTHIHIINTYGYMYHNHNFLILGFLGICSVFDKKMFHLGQGLVSGFRNNWNTAILYIRKIEITEGVIRTVPQTLFPEWIQNGEKHNGKITKRRKTKRRNYKTANIQNGESYKTANITKRRNYKMANITKRRILQNGEITKRRILQNGQSYKTANLKKNSENQAEYIQFKEYYKDYKTANLKKKSIYSRWFSPFFARFALL